MTQGTNERVVRVRLMGAEDLVQALAEKMVKLLEAEGLEMIEFSTPYPCREPDADKVKVFLTSIVKGKENGNRN